MNREDDQELWDLLGHPAEPELSPFFARNIARQVRQDGSRSERMRKWLGLRRLIPASAVAIALMATAIAIYHPVSHPLALLKIFSRCEILFVAFYLSHPSFKPV